MKKLFKENDLVKFITIAILLVVVLTWIIPGGNFSGTELIKNETLTRIGLSELSMSVVYAVSFFLQQLIFVAVIGAFYGVITKAEGYKVLVERSAKFVKGKEIPVVLVVSAIMATFVSLSSQVLVALIAIPFIITVLLNANLDKKTAFAATFGAIFIGMIGASYGTDGLNYFAFYMGTEIKKGLNTRFALLPMAYVIYSVFNVLHIKKVLAAKKVDESKDDTFAVEKTTRKKVKVWPIVVLLTVVFAFVVLGYIKWEDNFGIKIFGEWHTKLMELKLGKHTVIAYILGGAQAFGTWELYTIFAVLLIVSLITALVYRLSFDDIFDGAFDGVKKMSKPLVLMVLGYVIFVLLYWSPIVPTIVNKILATKFNVFRVAGSALVTSFFTADFGYTGYTIGQYLLAAYSTNIDKVLVIFPAMTGLMQMIAPTSIILLAGLGYSKVSYKEWIKYIWKTALALLVILLIIFAVM